MPRAWQAILHFRATRAGVDEEKSEGDVSFSNKTRWSNGRRLSAVSRPPLIIQTSLVKAGFDVPSPALVRLKLHGAREC